MSCRERLRFRPEGPFEGLTDPLEPLGVRPDHIDAAVRSVVTRGLVEASSSDIEPRHALFGPKNALEPRQGPLRIQDLTETPPVEACRGRPAPRPSIMPVN